MTALLDKRLDGFGELFRMLSYAEIGAAAMLTRATAGSIGTHGGLLAAGIRACRAPGDDQADPPGGRPRRAGAEAIAPIRSGSCR